MDQSWSRAPIVLCPISPHIGILDSWIPALFELKRRHPNLIMLALLAKDTAFRSVYPGDTVADLSDRLFDGVLRPIDTESFHIHSFSGAVQAIQQDGIKLKR